MLALKETFITISSHSDSMATARSGVRAWHVLSHSRLFCAKPLVQVSALTPCALPSAAYAALGQRLAGPDWAKTSSVSRFRVYRAYRVYRFRGLGFRVNSVSRFMLLAPRPRPEARMILQTAPNQLQHPLPSNFWAWHANTIPVASFM